MAANHHPRTSHSPRRTRASLDRERRKPRALALALCCILLGLATSGCATVKPYEREYLSRPSMDFEREATEAKFYSHVLDSREGATGGVGSAGGGCGCN
ncbi:MAG: DUF4266 domain-containing protein [Polyangiales bacterium]